MQPRRLATLLMIPSLLSASLSVTISLAILLITNWSYASPDSPLYAYLYGKYGLTTIFEQSSNALAAVNGIFSSPFAYNIAVLVVALFIGLLIYVLLEGLDHITAEASNTLHEVEQAAGTGAGQQMKRQLEMRAGLRVASLIVWVCYLIFFARVIIPLCIIIGRFDLLRFGMSDALSLIGAFSILVFSVHIHVILMRFLVLRPRLFGGDDIMISRSL